MGMKVSDKIIAPPRSTLERVLTYAESSNPCRPSDVRDYLTEVYRVAPLVGVDASICVAQSVHETYQDWSPWCSKWFKERLNPAGLGITGDPTQNAASHTFPNGAAAARGQIAHLLVYALGPNDAGNLWFRKTGVSITQDDPRYAAYLEAYGNVARAETIADLAGTWAADKQYAEGIVDKSWAIFGSSLPDQEDQPVPAPITFGNVEHPPVEIRDIPSSVNHAWDALGKRTIRGIVWHRSLGSHLGNDTYFRGEGATRALTDYGIGVKAQDGDALAGSLYRWNDPRGDRSPWANGSVSAPYGDGKAFVDRYGVAAVNRDLTSVEVSGFEETPLDPKSREALAQLTAYWADQYHVSWETFPLIPGEGNRSFVLWHEEITFGTGKRCPFAVVKAETNALIERAKQILKAAQTATATTTTRPPKVTTTTTTAGPVPLPPGMSQGLAEELFNPDRVGVDDGKAPAFVRGEDVAEAWLVHVLTTAKGGRWDAYQWPPLYAVTARGDGRIVYQFADGFVFEKAA